MTGHQSIESPLVPRRRTVPAECAERYFRAGLWTDETLGALVAERLAHHRSTGFRIWSQARPYDGKLGDVADLAARLAGGLRARGVGPGDVVSFQLPNTVEAAAVFYAGALLGAVLVPIVHIYGAKELVFILRQCGARAHITSSDRAPLLEGLGIETVVVVGDAVPPGMAHFDAVVEADPRPEPSAVAPDDVSVLAYTSGTTSDPKGVVHSHRTLLAELHQIHPFQPPLEGAIEAPPGTPPRLIASPVCHVTGMLTGLLSPLITGDPIHLMDKWDTGFALKAIVDADLSVGAGATFFLASLLDHPNFTPGHVRHMRYQTLGGSPVPAAVTERADAAGITIARCYGSTEHPSCTGSAYGAPRAKRLFTDGRAMAGVELRLDPDTGEIFTRGADLFLGYTDPELTRARVDDDGWYMTGDVGILDDEGYLTITDRLSDVIIRGGENISAAEVEGILGHLPGVAEVAVVAAPDPRYGERPYAFVRIRAGEDPPDLAAVREHLDRAGLARQKWPEGIEVVDDFDRTASGKVKKFMLRQRLNR